MPEKLSERGLMGYMDFWDFTRQLFLHQPICTFAYLHICTSAFTYIYSNPPFWHPFLKNIFGKGDLFDYNLHVAKALPCMFVP